MHLDVISLLLGVSRNAILWLGGPPRQIRRLPFPLPFLGKPQVVWLTFSFFFSKFSTSFPFLSVLSWHSQILHKLQPESSLLSATMTALDHENVDKDGHHLG